MHWLGFRHSRARSICDDRPSVVHTLKLDPCAETKRLFYLGFEFCPAPSVFASVGVQGSATRAPPPV